MSTAIVKKLQNRKNFIFNSQADLEDALSSFTNPLKPEDTTTLQLYIDELKPLYEQLKTIMEELADNDIDISAECRNFKRKYMTTLGKAQAMINTTFIQNSAASSSISESPQVKLPAVEIHKFSGDYEQWTTFRDSFTAMIHNNEQLSNIQKFHYLQSALRGEAASILKCLTLSNEGYEVAWNTLQKRYQNERFLVKKHVRTLLNLPEMKKNDHVSLRHLIDTVSITLSALKALKRPADTWDDMLIEIVSENIDGNLRKEWEGDTCDEIPSYTQLEKFLTSKCRQLEAMKNSGFAAKESSTQHKVKVFQVNTADRKCNFCKGEHIIYKCIKFNKLTVQERINAVKQSQLCFNCLGKNHSVNNCNSITCRKCNKRHHTLLHNLQEPTEPSEGASRPAAVNLLYSPSNVLLSTCNVLVKDNYGRQHTIRVLLDGGAQANLISSSCVKLLGLRKIKNPVPINGITSNSKSLNHVVSTTITSRFSPFKLPLHALVIDKIPGKIPLREIDFDSTKIPRHFELADPTFHIPQDVDLLISNAHQYDIITEGRFKLNSLSLINTHFGWIVYGESTFKNHTQKDSAMVCYQSLNDVLSKFWELENHKEETLTPAEGRCEEHFVKNTTRDRNGRFIVALPFKQDPCCLGDSSISAKHRFLALERRLAKTADIYAEYRSFMHEYEALGHMKKTVGDVKTGYYLPHHCVMKQSSLTTKLRVVFNGYAPTTTGISLNDILMVGPTVQNDLFSIMIRMRCWKYVITADIAKMYRQVRVREEDMKFQRIWWRNHPEDPLTSYELTTVTYGTASAAYLAIRALRELAGQMRGEYPIGSARCLLDFYVDDLITGANTLVELKQVRDEVNGLLNSGGFELKRWASNNVNVFVDFKRDCNDNITVLTRDSEHTTDAVTTLGTVWNTSSDVLMYKCNIQPPRSHYTKRIVLSELARIYDPLGLIGPIIISGKVFIQDLWKLKCGWDDDLPDTYKNRWLEYAESLKGVASIHIPRMVTHCGKYNLELHGFSDASEKAYGACIYVVGVHQNIGVYSNLICAKSRVAPVKSTSIPRLELCAAVLLAELNQRVCTALSYLRLKCHFYSDSTITLSWIKADSRRFKTFVANRIGEIQKLTRPEDWNHVTTGENPADLISRGCPANSLKDNKLWWMGPEFLLGPKQPSSFIPAASPPEVKCNVLLVRPDDVILPKCSSFEKTVRVIAYVLRFTNNLLKRGNARAGPLSISEQISAEILLLKNLQALNFKHEMDQLRKGLSVSPSSQLAKLNPFIDSNGLLRVGGRLAYSELSNNRRFPILLPSKHNLTKLLVISVHRHNLHIGAQGTLAAIRLRFWPLSGRNLVRGVVRCCVRCIRAKPDFQSPLMAALPPYRSQQTRPFLRSGVDYCGPFVIKEGSRRSKRTTKAYICIFICCSTKAIHIELVSTLTSEAFIGAFNRFISRRGCVAEIISDNATNFLGARNHLRELGLFLREPEKLQPITSNLSRRQIKWTFIPPRAPHFGGLWEAAVKSVKTHLHRVAGKALLTAEELNTLLAQIEAVLNSRPLCPISDDPNDFAALTPAHFLIGDVLTVPVDPDFTETPDNRLSRWEMVQKMRQHIWKRWSREYLSELHSRGKWTRRTNLPTEGQLVIIKEDNIPPLQWHLGRIEEVHLGPDGIPRSARVRTSTTTMVRPMVKLCQLLRE